VVLTLLCVGLGWQLKRAHRQREAVQAIQEYGGSVLYDFEFDAVRGAGKADARPWAPQWVLDAVGIDFFHRVASVNLAWSLDASGKQRFNQDVSPDAIGCLANLPHVRQLAMQGHQATDAYMEYVAQLRELETLYIFPRRSAPGGQIVYPRVTDAGIALLTGSKKLRSVHIDEAPLTDESLRTFGGLPRLERLVLQGAANAFTDDGLKHLKNSAHLRELNFSGGYGATEFTDAGLAQLTALHKLETVSLRGGAITDRGLDSLSTLPRLKQVHIAGNGMTDDGVARFRAKLPNAVCTVAASESFTEALQAVIAWLFKLDRAQVRPDATWETLEVSPEDRFKLVAFLTEQYFDLNPAGGAAFTRRASSDDVRTVSQLADLVQQMVGRPHE
jgi:hypothetical protein